MPFEFFISRRYLKSRQKQAFISLITLLSIAGVTIGVMALIIVIGVMAGFESDLKSRMLDVDSHVKVLRSDGKFTDYKTVLDQVDATEGVIAATPVVFSQVIVKSAYGLSGVMLRGIDPKIAGKVITILDQTQLSNLSKKNDIFLNSQSDSGTGQSEVNVPGILLGHQLASQLKVSKDDLVYVISPRWIVSPIGHMPAMKKFKVAGVFESGVYDIDGAYAYIHLKDAQSMLKMENKISWIEIKVQEVFKARIVADRIVAKLGYPFWAQDWTQLNRSLFSALKLEKTVMFIILTLIIVVAALNIASALIMLVMEKTRDIAILKAMGATHKQIRRIFVYQGLMIGAMGTLLGEVFGYIICGLLKHYEFIDLPPDIYYISKLPVLIDTDITIIIAVASLLICYLATLYPAHQAAKLNPVEAFRYG